MHFVLDDKISDIVYLAYNSAFDCQHRFIVFHWEALHSKLYGLHNYIIETDSFDWEQKTDFSDKNSFLKEAKNKSKEVNIKLHNKIFMLLYILQKHEKKNQKLPEENMS